VATIEPYNQFFFFEVSKTMIAILKVYLAVERGRGVGRLTLRL